MDSQDQRTTHTPGHENHGVHVCHKCGWSFPNPHPSAKQRRAHKKICGTIQGDKLPISHSEGQTHFMMNNGDGSDNDDHKTPGSNNDKGNDGIGDKLIRSEDEVFSDAVADFSDTGPSLGGVKNPLQQDGLDSSVTDVERVNTKEQKLSGSSEYNDFNAADVSPLIIKPSNDSQIDNPKILHSESVEVGNIVGLQGQLSGSTVDPLTSSVAVADLRTEELSIVHGDDLSGLSSDSRSPSKAEAMPDLSPEKNIYPGENVTDCSLKCVEKESNLKEKEEAKSERDMVEFVDASDNAVAETFEGVSKIAVSDTVSLDHEVDDGAVDPKEKKGPEFLSLPPQDEFPVELNSSVVTNEAQVESAHAIQFTTCGDVKVLQEKDDENGNIDPLLDVASPQSESLKHEEDVTEENKFHFNASQLSERSHFLSSDMHVMDSNMKMETKDVHGEDCTEVSPVKLTTETYQRSKEIGVSMKTEMNENYFSEDPGADDVNKNSQPEGSLVVSSNESQRDASFGSATGETIIVDYTSHRVKNTNEINDVAVDVKDVGVNVENDIEIILKDFQPSDFLQSEVEKSSDLFKNKNDDAIEQCEITDTQCKQIPTEIDPSMPKSAISHFDIPVTSDVVIDGPARKSSASECTNVDPISDINEDEINSNIELHEEHNASVDTSTDLHEARDAQPLAKAAEDLASKYASDSSINTEPSAQHDSTVEDDSGGEPGGEASGITAMPVQDQSGNNLVKLSSSGIDTPADSHEVPDAQLFVKAAEDLTSHSSINTEPSAQHASAAEDDSGGEPGGEASGITVVPVQDQSGNNLVKHSSSGIDASVDSGSRCDSLEGNWGSVSVLSMQSDAPAEILPSTGKSNLNLPQAAADRHQSGKSEIFEPPSFMTLVESKGAASSEVQNPQQTDSTSQASWFPTLNQVINDSQGRKNDEEIIAKVTNWSRNSSKEHTPLKSFLGETNYSNKPKSPKMEENNGFGLTTVNSILGPESPPAAAQVMRGDAANEWNSPARYPANIKREKRKFKSKPFWIQLVCCSTTVNPQRR